MSSIGIVVDSTAGFDPDYAARRGFAIVPLYLRIDGETLRDVFDIGPAEFYRRLPHTDPLPTTSQPSAGDFARVYRRLVEEGAEAIVSIHLSSEISGTVNSARLAAEQLDGVPVEVVDTRSAAAAHLFAVEAALQARDAGGSLEDIVAAARGVIAQHQMVFAVDTLEYLYKGGRIGGAAALMGSLLQFRPLLHFENGTIDVLEKVRTSRRALRRIAELMAEGQNGERQQVIVFDAAAPERAEELSALLRELVHVQQLRHMPLPPVLGSHVGNGTIAVCCCPVSRCGERLDPEAVLS